MVILTLILPWLAAWVVADKLPPEWFADPGGLKLPKGEVALLVVVLSSLFLVASVGYIA